MANIFKNSNGFAVNPIVIDTVWTAGTIPADLTTISSGGPQRFRRIVWTNPITPATDTLVIQDISGNTLFSEVCAVAHQDIVLWDNSRSPYAMKQGQWVVSTIGSGKLLLYK